MDRYSGRRYKVPMRIPRFFFTILVLSPFALAQTSGQIAPGSLTSIFGTTLAAAMAAPSSVPATPQILSQFAFGGGWYSAVYFSNSGATAASFEVNFAGDTSAPLAIPSIGSSTTVNLAPQGTTILEALNLAGSALAEGYVTASLPEGVTGYGVFRQSVPGVPDQEAVVPLTGVSSSSVSLIWDDTAYTTAVAIVNPSSVSVIVQITAWDSSGTVIGSSSIPLGPGAKTEAALRGLPGLSGVVGNRGSAQFNVSTGSVAVLGLRFNGTAFTSIPTTSP